MAQAVRAHTVQNTWSQVQIPTVLVHLQVCESKNLGCNAGNQEVSRCHQEVNLRNSLNAGMQARNPPCPGNQDRCHQKFKTEVSVDQQKGLISSNFFLKLSEIE